MKPRNIWIRKKGKGCHVVEGRTTKGNILLWTIPTNLYHLTEHLLKTSFFTEEKTENIRSKLDSLTIKEPTKPKQSPEVRVVDIKRTPKNDYNTDVDLWEMTK